MEALQLASNEALLYSFHSQVVSASIAPFPTSIQPNNIAMIARNGLQKSESLSWYLNNACLRYLILEQNAFVSHLAEFTIKIKCANRDYLLAKDVEKIRLSCLKEDGFTSSKTINDVLYIPEAKKNLLFLGQPSE